MSKHPVQIKDLQTTIKLGKEIVAAMNPDDVIVVNGRLVTAADIEAETLRTMDALARETGIQKATTLQLSQ